MLSPDYVLSMARYNAWQNRQMKAALEALPEAELRRDRGAFFGSIFATVNHLLWAEGHLYSASRDETIKQWDVTTGTCTNTFDAT